ncbi:DUF2961 domain-containing protein [Mucilaginibacter terrigena]|uniref:DUF2961 domain-containing protein n=2 Tax=Mucilaginibacter terrigena TaxID=2492395 RepID=A0A4Q5LSQ6_9SPHI|nr:DUF2961 domain-containing protein [Mucilaginibacter terrigena]
MAFVACTSSCSNSKQGNKLYQFDENADTRWSSPENLNGEKGQGGKENNTAKGHPSDSIPAGRSKALLDIQGQGVIDRIWITINDRSPEMLRSLKIEMFWDGETKPAVSVPFGDFFGNGLAKTAAFENELFVSGEGRSFSCFIPMPFKKGAKIVVTNESGKSLHDLYFDVNYTLSPITDNSLYFHAFWHRDTSTVLAKDFELLPNVRGNGRFLGVNIGVNANPQYRKSWFGEGEVKYYMDSDDKYPTLNGTGTEDYIGTGWGQGKFINRFAGCTIANDTLLQWAFYRYHIKDPIFFKNNLRVAMQQIGGAETDSVAAYLKEGAPLIAVTTQDGKLHPFYNNTEKFDPSKPGSPKGWTNFYRRDDISATAYFYLDKPSSDLPALQPVAIRKTQLRDKKIK